MTTSPIEARPQIAVYVNDELVVTDQAPIVRNGTTLLPVRAIFEALNLKVSYDKANAKVFSKLRDSSFTINYKSSDYGEATHMIIDPSIKTPLDESRYYDFTYPQSF